MQNSFGQLSKDRFRFPFERNIRDTTEMCPNAVVSGARHTENSMALVVALGTP